MKGVRLWMPFGGAQATKVRDVTVDSQWNSTYYFLASVVRGWSSLPYNQRYYITTRFCWGMSMEEALAKAGLCREDLGNLVDPWNEIGAGEEDGDEGKGWSPQPGDDQC